MQTNLKTILITIGCTAAVTLSGMFFIFNKVIAKNTEEINNIKGQNVELAKQLKDQMVLIKDSKDQIAKLTTEVASSHQETQDAIKKLHDIIPPPPPGHVDTPDKVKDDIHKYYGDIAVGFDGQYFSLGKETTYLVVSDAVQWKVQGPYYQTKLAAYDVALNASQKENENKDRLIATHVNTELQYDRALGLCNEASTNKDRIIQLYERNLKLESINGNIKFVFGVGVATAGYIIYDKLIKR